MCIFMMKKLFCEKCAHARKKVVQNHENIKIRLNFYIKETII